VNTLKAIARLCTAPSDTAKNIWNEQAEPYKNSYAGFGALLMIGDKINESEVKKAFEKTLKNKHTPALFQPVSVAASSSSSFSENRGIYRFNLDLWGYAILSRYS
jgi:hypothetical protein